MIVVNTIQTRAEEYERVGRDLLGEIARWREIPGKEAETLKLIEKVKCSSLNMVVELMFEMILVQQHLVMVGIDAEENLERMSTLTEATGKFIHKNNLKSWEARLGRFEGRRLDYLADRAFISGRKDEARKMYAEAKHKYEQAISSANSDPEFVINPAREAEYRAFAAYDAVMLEGADAVGKAQKLYAEFEVAEWGKKLKRDDYVTWAIWRSGIFIRTAKALDMLGLVHSNREMLTEWLIETDKLLIGNEFGIRKLQIAEIRDKLGG